MAVENNTLLDSPNTTELSQGIDQNDAVIEAKKYEELLPVPPEINELMSTIDEMLQRGEEIPDSLIQELESQINTAGDFEVEDLFQKFSKASSFYGISSILNDAHLRAMQHHGFSKEAPSIISTEESMGAPTMPYIPPASDDELMEYMSQEHGDYAPVTRVTQGTSVAAISERIDDVRSNKETPVGTASSVESPAVEHKRQPGPAEQAVSEAKAGESAKSTPKKDSVQTKSDTKPELASKEDVTPKDKGIAPTNQTLGNSQQPQVQSMPLLGSLASTFNSMMGFGNKNKSVKTHLSSSDFGKTIVANKIVDFEKLCTKHLGGIENISDLAKLSTETFSDKASDVIKSRVTEFMTMSEVLGKEYGKLLKSASPDENQVTKIKNIAKEHAEKLKASKGELSKVLRDNAPSSLVKLLGGVMESVKNIINKVFQIRPEATKQNSVTNEPQPN
jgi:hypothetical protein